MSEQGAEGILRRRAEAQKAASSPAPDAQHDVERKPAEGGGGRVAGAAKGAAGGSAAGPEGALGGAVLGFITGRKSRPKGAGKKALTGEFLLCMAVLIMAPLRGSSDAGAWMRKASATAVVFMLLGFTASMGDTSRKVANGIGLLVTIALVVDQADVFGNVLTAIQSASGAQSSAARAAADTAAVGGRTPEQVVNDIITGDPTIQPAGSDFTSILGTQPGVVGTPAGPNVGIPGLPAGIGGNG